MQRTKFSGEIQIAVPVAFPFVILVSPTDTKITKGKTLTAWECVREKLLREKTENIGPIPQGAARTKNRKFHSACGRVTYAGKFQRFDSMRTPEKNSVRVVYPGQTRESEVGQIRSTDYLVKILRL